MRVPSDREIWREALDIIVRELPPSKASRVIAALELGRGDYLEFRDAVFGGRSVKELSAQIRRYRTRVGRKRAG